MNTQQLMTDNMLCRMLGGSHAYGTNIATSDVDYRGLFFAQPESIRTPFFPLREITDTREEDTKYYELSQFMHLFTAANPNILELAYTDMKHVELTSDPYELLRANAKSLLSKKVAFTFSGYAISQLKRIKGHNKWINNTQSEVAPTHSSCVTLVHNFTSDKVFKLNFLEINAGHVLAHYGNDVYGVYKKTGGTLFNKDFTLKVCPQANIEQFTGANRVMPLYLVKFNRDQYETSANTWKNYWAWKKNRNESRGELEEAHGYDTKHAMHLVRLLNMGEEILTTGDVNVFRPDAAELLAIRAGKWEYNDIVSFAEEKDNRIRNELYNTSSLPKSPDLKAAAKLLMDMQDMCWDGQVNLRKVDQSTQD